MGSQLSRAKRFVKNAPQSIRNAIKEPDVAAANMRMLGRDFGRAALKPVRAVKRAVESQARDFRWHFKD